jgi:uncharacterized repeat protein (TIGR01451 family)
MSGADGNAPCSKEKGSTTRQLGLAIVLGLLGMLIFALTANAYVAVKIDDTLVDFDQGTFIRTGLLDIPEKDIDSVQLLPIGLTGEWQTSPQRLPQRLADMATATNGYNIYVIGGTDQLNAPRGEVYSTMISDVWGTLIPWRTEQLLPESRTGAASAVNTRPGGTSTLYVVGGLKPGWIATNTVFRAQVDNTTGRMVGDWATDAQTLPQALYYASAVVHNGFLYVLGGSNVLASFDTVYYAAINSDGSLQPFGTTSAMPHALFDGYAVVYDGLTTDTIYYVGGAYITGTFEIGASFEVYFADIESGGSLSPWARSEGALPRHIYAHSGVLVNQGEIIVTGGIDDPLDPMNSFTSTVKAALVDPENPSFRLYDWCLGEQPPICTIGAWQTGGLLPDVRALHGTVGGRGYIYVMGGEDGQQTIRDTVFFGTVNGVGALYSPDGVYQSQEFDLEQPAKLRKLTWDATLGHPGEMGLTMQYRTSEDGNIWTGWSTEESSVAGLNEIVPDPAPIDIRYVQYQVDFTTSVSNASPLLNDVRIYYEVRDPDVQVIKDTGSVISVALNTTLQYTIHYTNTGGWVAENVVLTETLPEHTSYVEEPGWHQVDSSGVYTYRVGDVEWGDTGIATFRVHVNEEVPYTTHYITNQVEIDYPPMIDAFGETIIDPNLDDNLYQFRTPLSFFVLTVTKEAMPPPGSIVMPGTKITYTLRYTNIGQIEAAQAVLTDTFDPRGSYVVISPTLPPNTPEYTWDVGPLPPKASGQKTIVVQLNDPLPNHWVVTNQATLSSPQDDPYHSEVISHTVMNLTGGEPEPIVDLAVTNVRWEPSEPLIGNWPKFYATVINSGTAGTLTDFWMALYIKPQPSDPPWGPADHDRGYCLNNCQQTRYNYLGYISSLELGQSKEVPFLYLSDDPSPDFPGLGFYDVYAQVDVAFAADNAFWGKLPEDYESNNIWYKSLNIPKAKIRLPIIFKQTP